MSQEDSFTWQGKTRFSFLINLQDCIINCTFLIICKFYLLCVPQYPVILDLDCQKWEPSHKGLLLQIIHEPWQKSHLFRVELF